MHIDNQADSLLCQLLALFPYEQVRPIQSAALEVVAKMIESGKRFSILEAPTGSGKSALALTAARYAGTLDNLDDEFEPGAYILTPYNNLAAAMISDFEDQGLTSLKGRKHYGSQSGSAYEEAKADFFGSTESVTNYAYFLLARHAPKRQMLILDEGHKIEMILANLAGFRITPGICSTIGIDGPPTYLAGELIVDWLGAVFLPALRKQASRCRELTAAQRELEDLIERVAKYTGMGDRSQWIAWMDNEELNVKPLSVTAEARELFARARYVLILSATIFDFAAFQRVLGITDPLVFSAPSDFPLPNRPIVYRPAGDMSSKSIERTIPRLCAEIEQIVGSFGGCKGAIHTCSHYINQRVASHLTAKYGCRRIISHGRNSHDRERAIRHHCECEEATVLVSPSLTEGVDLNGDLARFQIICKVPYPRLDAYTRARAARDRAWYRMRTAWELVQMVGRAVRSDTDYATTFVLDSQFEHFVTRNKDLLPDWWRAAIQKGR